MDEKTGKALEFLFRVLATFLLLELITLPLRPLIVSLLERFLYSFLPKSFVVEWACTGLDEVFLLASALWWALPERKRWRSIAVGTIILEAYNLARIVILAYVPDEALHDILFRWGGFLLITAVFYILAGRRTRNIKQE